MQSLYNVPIIPLNLRKEETIVQIAEVLQYLEDVSTDIFNRVDQRIQRNSERLVNITERIDEASRKILSLSGAKKATQVFSSSKYPAAHLNHRYQSVFDRGEPVTLRRHDIKFPLHNCSEEPLDHLQFYHVKIRRQENRTPSHGLGAIPKQIECFNDILLYNTGKNPYKNYEMSDTLRMTRKTKEDDTIHTSDIGAPPISISARSATSKIAAESYFYSPNLGEVPSIDVPLDLPDLPGIADDLRFVNDANVVIAPSVTTTPNVPDLPSFSELASSSSLEIDIPAELPVPPVPPSLPPAVKVEVKEEVKEVPVIVKETDNTPVPEIKDAVEERKPSAPADISDAHAKLMEAIRQAGGSRNAKLKAPEGRSDDKVQPSGGNLMADLHAKLAMRRKGISGAKLAGSEPANAMDKVSAMIPPPPQSSMTNEKNSATEDEEWDD